MLLLDLNLCSIAEHTTFESVVIAIVAVKWFNYQKILERISTEGAAGL